jgi:hypothetical protein
MALTKGNNGLGLPAIKLFSSSSAKVHPLMYENVTIIDGKTFYTGNAINGKKSGQGTYIDYSAHVEYTGEWLNDNIHGVGTITNYFEDYSFTGKFENNTMIYGTMTWPNGTVYIGYFENNEIHGLGTIKWPNNSKYEGMFENGKIHGFGSYTDNKGNVCEKEF